MNNAPNGNAPQIEPGMILWGHWPSHDKGLMWHPAIVLRVEKCNQRTIVTAALGTSRRVCEDHAPTELVCYSDEPEFQRTGLRTDTRFNMAGLRFQFRPGTCKETIVGAIDEIGTPTLYRRLILACQSTRL